MFVLILGIIIILGGLAAVIYGAADHSAGAVAGGATAVVVGIVVCILSFFTSVSTGHTGIVTTFGKVEDYTLDAGISTKKPWQSVIEMDNRVQKSTTDLSSFSADIQEVSVSYTVNYQINKATASQLYKTVGKAYYDTVIAPTVAECVKVVTARYTAEELVGSRDVLAVAIEEMLTESLNKYNIEVVSTAIEDLDFTDAFTNAVEAKQVAAQNKLKAETEQAQKTMEAEQAAQRQIIEAEANAEVARINAEADLTVTKIQADAAEYAGQKESAANKAIADNLSSDLLQYYYIKQWDGKLPSTFAGSDNVSSIIMK